MEPLPTAEAAALVLLAPFAGSFLATLVHRLPAGEPLAWARSRCPRCGRALGVRDLVPIASWALQRGRCRRCGARIDPAYPAIEAGALVLALWALAVVPGWLAWATAGLGWVLLALAVIDLRHLLLPDSLTLALVPAGLLAAWLVEPAALPHHAAGAAAGFAAMLAVRATYARLRRREGLGLGDAKLMAGAGAWVSWTGLPSVLLWAAGTALLAHLAAALRGRGDGDRPLPFGPYLALGLWLVWLYGPLHLAP